jgi:hypothetical protein
MAENPKCQMTKFKVQMKSKWLNIKWGPIDGSSHLKFRFDLTFACLPVGRDFGI